jgi:hypothetical protein
LEPCAAEERDTKSRPHINILASGIVQNTACPAAVLSHLLKLLSLVSTAILFIYLMA